jgi:uncharacterized membrane protein YedE/YeeE
MRLAMKNLAVVFFCGVLFALGLGIGGMTQPVRIFGFLDVAGQWDPTLLVVMAGALLPYFVISRIALRRAQPLLTERFALPTKSGIDARLLSGAAVFGAGWGLGGYCPAPALTGLVSGNARPVVLVLGMAAGMVLYEWVMNRRASSAAPTPDTVGVAALALDSKHTDG